MGFKYLEDGTPYVSTELDERFSSLTDEINDLTAEEVGWGALGPYHLPMLIGRSGRSQEDAEPSPLNPFSVSSQVNIDTVTTYGDGDIISSPSLFYSLPIDMTKDNVSAVLVCFNVFVSRVFANTTPDNKFASEDRLYVTFCVWVEDSLGESKRISKTRRSISPGLMVFPSSPASEGQIKSFLDVYSFKDAAIRSMIFPETLTTFGLVDIKRIYIKVETGLYTASVGPAIDTNIKLDISTATLTAIPIQAKVLKPVVE